MKQIAITIALLGSINLAASAQTNRTYYSNMQTPEIYENERRGGTPNNNPVKLNLGTETVAEENNALRMTDAQYYQGYATGEDDMINGKEKFGNKKWNDIERGDLPYRSVPYDTSKNNGHCIGCGSGTMTDPHRWAE